MRIIDQSGSAHVLVFNNLVHKLCGRTTWELMEKHGMDVDEHWPSELDVVVGKKFLFKVLFSDYSVNNNNHTYRCNAFNDEPDMINHFKKGFWEDEDVTVGSTALHSPPVWGFTANLIKTTKFNDPNITCVLDMQTPSKETKASGSGKSSDGEKKRIFIDLDDIDSDEENGGSNSKTPKLVQFQQLYI
ncbi:hypothetical protein OROHE_014486 [Orobanche hederae]